MSFLATLTIEGGIEFNVLDCSFEFYRDIDMDGRPTSLAHGGRINITVESTNNNDFYAWIIDPAEFKNGEIVFYKRDMASSYKRLIFYNSVVVRYGEVFSNTGDVPMKTVLVISAQEIQINDVSHTNSWYGQD